jgi:multiple sugar transport system permease protein
MLLSPFGVLFALFFLLPICYAVYQSLLKVRVSGLGLGPGSTTTVFAGFANYAQGLLRPVVPAGRGAGAAVRDRADPGDAGLRHRPGAAA